MGTTRSITRDQNGFTLVEIMAVVLIIAVLILIAIPTFIGARKHAQDRATQSSLRNTVATAKAIFTDDEDYTDVTEGALQSREPGFSFMAAHLDSEDSFQISIKAEDESTFFSASFSEAGRCWYVKDVARGGATGTFWGVHDQSASTGCNADAASTWSGTYVHGAGKAVSA